MTVAASELQSVKDELQALGMAIAHIHEQYSIATQKVDAMTKMLQSKLDDLEADNKKQASEMVSLRTKNAELQNLVETKKPDVWKAIDARDVALFKLSHARRVIRDLLDERKQIDPSGPRVTSLRSSRHGGAVTSDRSSGSWDELDLTEAGPSSPSDGDDDRTVRPRAPTTASTIVASSPTGSDAEAYEQRSCTGMDKDESTTLKARQGSPEDTLTERELASSSSQDLVSTSQDGWYLEYLKPPATAEASIGGFTYPALAEFLKLDDDTMICIESLEWWEDPCMRIHIHVDMAFVYNPLVLEGPSSSYLISWGNDTTNRNVERYITHGRSNSPPFHMFILPIAKNAWWYVGMHTWTPTDVQSVWRMLNKKDKKVLCSELKQRWNSKLSRQEIAQLIEQGELRQCCIELRSQGQSTASLEFARSRLGVEGVSDDEANSPG